HKRLRRLIGNEAPHELRGNETSCTWMFRKDIDDYFAIANSTGIDLMSKNSLFSVVVQARAEDKFTTALGPFDGPSGQSACDFLNVLLRTAAINAKRVQFHQLAGVILVNPTNR